MVACCVPLCTSTSKNKRSHKGSFHEFPSNVKLRELWIKNISREGNIPGSIWLPNDRSVVCDLHFTSDDFKKGLTYKFLKPAAVPSVFTNYPQHMQDKIRKETTARCPKVGIKNQNIMKGLAGQQVDPKSKENLQTTNVEKFISKDSAATKEIVGEEVNLKSKKSLQMTDDDKFMSKDSTAQNNEQVPVTKDATTQAQFLFPSRYKTFANKQNALKLLKRNKIKINKLNNRINYLQTQIRTLKTTKGRSSLEKKLFKAVKEAESNSLGDQFFIELLKAFQNSLHTWSDDSLKACMTLFDESPAGYRFIKESRLIDLPEEKILMDYAGCTFVFDEEEDAGTCDSSFPIITIQNIISNGLNPCTSDYQENIQIELVEPELPVSNQL